MTGEVAPSTFGSGLNGDGEGGGFLWGLVGFEIGGVLTWPISDGIFCPFGLVEFFCRVAREGAGDLPLCRGEDGRWIGGVDIGVDDAFEVVLAGAETDDGGVVAVAFAADGEVELGVEERGHDWLREMGYKDL